jgi:serine/threonine protein kinase/WD40 repeat protein
MTDSSSDDPDGDTIARLLAEIDAGRMAFESAVAAHPNLEARLREVASLQRLLKTAQGTAIPDAPKNLGEYRIVGVVGQGGMGVVYRAYHERLQREVAVKTIRPTHVSPSARERFLREQTALARLHQTHIVPIYAAGTDGAVEYFVMPYIEGASLHRVLESLRRGFAGRGTTSDSLFSLVSTAAEGRASRSTSSFASLRAETESLEGRPETNGRRTPIEGNVETPRSPAYFRSAATIIANAAEGLEHAHRRGVYHRDLKPNNVMLAADGRLWIIDFGLAAFLPHESADAGPTPAGDGLATNAAVGTWSYMAPEQFERKADARTDVWGLGVTLYETLTLRRAFAHRSSSEWREASAAEHPPHPAEAAPALPADLAAVCWKAMARDPKDRYQSAGALAEDLRRWLRDDPVAARKRNPVERARRWIVRHRAWTAVIVLSMIAAPTMIALQYRATVKARAEIAEQGRQLIVRELESLLGSDRRAGWSAGAAAKIAAAASIRKDDVLRDAVVASLAGEDATTVAHVLAIGGSAAAYDATGKRLLLSGTSKRRNHAGSPAHLWNLDERTPKPGKADGPGLVAFQRDGTPVQLVGDNSGRLRVLHVETGAALREYSLPRAQEGGEPPTMALGKEGDLVAGSFRDQQSTFVWSRLGAARRLAVGASAIAFNDDGTVVAVGSPSGETSIWSVDDGRRLASFTLAPLSVQALAFSGRVRRNGDVVAGDVAVAWYGRGAIVDLTTGRPNCFFETDEHVPKNLAFAPDGATVVADNILFDAASGRRLLTLSGQMEAFAFAPDGGEFVQAAGEGFIEPQVLRQSFDRNRGVLQLHGLRTPCARIALSMDGRVIAALSRDWRIGVWDVASGRLLRLVDLPEGPFADNAALALDDAGTRLAGASGTSACLWDVSSGRRLQHWSLPPGFSNELAFTAAGGLTLVRSELQSMADYPSRIYRYSDHPRRIRGRDLLTSPEKPIFEIDAFPMHSYGIALTPNGERVLVDGLSLEGVRSVRLFDGRTGGELRRYPLAHERDYDSLHADSAGPTMVFEEDPDAALLRVIDAAEGAPRERLRAALMALGPGGDSWLGSRVPDNEPSLGIYRRGSERPIFRLSHFSRVHFARFSAHGRLLALTGQGFLDVVDLVRVERRLQELGLD